MKKPRNKPIVGPKLNGYYASETGFEKYDQTSYRYLIKFYENGLVRKGILRNDGFREVGSGAYSVNGSVLTCQIDSTAGCFESRWIGKIQINCILFEIVNPDFEDIEGYYTFIQDTNAIDTGF